MKPWRKRRRQKLRRQKAMISRMVDMFGYYMQPLNPTAELWAQRGSPVMRVWLHGPMRAEDTVRESHYRRPMRFEAPQLGIDELVDVSVPYDPSGFKPIQDALAEASAGMDMQAHADRAFRHFLTPHDPSEFFGPDDKEATA